MGASELQKKGGMILLFNLIVYTASSNVMLTIGGQDMKHTEPTREEKMKWLAQASNEELLRQLVELEITNSYGRYTEDIRITREEILKRMGK